MKIFQYKLIFCTKCFVALYECIKYVLLRMACLGNQGGTYQYCLRNRMFFFFFFFYFVYFIQ